MGYSEFVCQLCGVSLAIARIRTPIEPVEDAWSYTGESFVDSNGYSIEQTCGKLSGCQNVQYPEDNRANALNFGEEEHVAGPGCVSTRGYSGYRITVEEMKGCRAVQCLMRKDRNWKSEDDDQDFELESRYFLTGLGDGSPDEAPLQNITPSRHGIVELLIANLYFGDDDTVWGLPFHPTCFEVFNKISRNRLGRVDVHGLWEWRKIDCTYESFFKNFPREFAVKNGCQQWWKHARGTEYLAANPVKVPGLPSLLHTCHKETIWGAPRRASGEPRPYDVNAGVFGWTYKAYDEHYKSYHTMPPPGKLASSNDPFLKLSTELLYMILDKLSTKDIVSLRLVTRAYRQLPIILFRRLLLDDMPWLWEVHTLPIHQTDWYKMYTMVRSSWQNIKGLRNRKRIWRDVNEIVSRIERFRKEGKISDE